MFEKWIAHPARWYQFWFPQSGYPGGLIAGGLIQTLVTILHEIFQIF